jgi:hypothetical protein
MKSKVFAFVSALALTCVGFVASAPAEAAGGSCSWSPYGSATKPARYTIWVSGNACNVGYGARVYFYNSSSSATEYSTTSARVTHADTQAQAGPGTIYSRGGAW